MKKRMRYEVYSLFFHQKNGYKPRHERTCFIFKCWFLNGYNPRNQQTRNLSPRPTNPECLGEGVAVFSQGETLRAMAVPVDCEPPLPLGITQRLNK
jgi:hypothetical protein